MTDKILDRRRILKGASALGVAGALTALAAPDIGLASTDVSTVVLGTWNETVTLHSNGQSFQTLYTYSPGGGVTGTGQTDLTPATLAGPIHGTWIKTGESSVRWLVHAFSYDPQGNPNGVWNITENSKLNAKGNSYSGTGTAEIVFNGVVTYSDTYTVIATKVVP